MALPRFAQSADQFLVVRQGEGRGRRGLGPSFQASVFFFAAGFLAGAFFSNSKPTLPAWTTK